MKLRELEREFILDCVDAMNDVVAKIYECKEFEDSTLEDILPSDSVLEDNLYDYQYKHGAITHEEWLKAYEDENTWCKEDTGYEVIQTILNRTRELIEEDGCNE